MLQLPSERSYNRSPRRACRSDDAEAKSTAALLLTFLMSLGIIIAVNLSITMTAPGHLGHDVSRS